jgi:ATP adenylyltransferase
MEYIAAPWRREYVRKVLKMKECVFCRALELNNDKETYILHRGKHNFILLNKFPYTPGHLMIAPYVHMDSFEKAERDSAIEIADLLKLSLRVLRKKYNPQGFNVGMNIGKSAGAGVADHYHLHVIPRWEGDSNFMPLICDTKMTIEDLKISYERLLPAFHEEIQKE